MKLYQMILLLLSTLYFSLYIKASQFTVDPGNVQPDSGPPEVTTDTTGTFLAIV